MSHCRNGTPCWCLPILLEHDLSPYGQKSRSCFTTKQSIIWGVHSGQNLFEVAIDLFYYPMGPNQRVQRERRHSEPFKFLFLPKMVLSLLSLVLTLLLVLGKTDVIQIFVSCRFLHLDYTVFKPCVRESHISEICVQEIHDMQGIGVILFSTEYRCTVTKCVTIVLPRIPKSFSQARLPISAIYIWASLIYVVF